MTNSQLTFEQKVEATHREVQRQVERRDRSESSPGCEACKEARRFRESDSDEVRAVLARWVGHVLTEAGLDEIVGIVEEANEDALRAWLIVEEMDEAQDQTTTIDTEVE